MIKIVLSSIFGCLTLLGFTQENTVATGGDFSGSNGSVSYSVGQIDYSYAQGNNGSINQGVQQVFEFFVGLGEELNMDLSLYPNPTNECVMLQLGNFTPDLVYTLTDMTGKVVAQSPINASEIQIDMREYATGTYQLIISNDTIHQTIKILKH